MNYRTIITAVRIIIVLAILGLLVFGAYKLSQTLNAPASRVNLDQSSVVLHIRSLNRLETASFTIEKIIEAGTEGNAFQNILYGDRILLIAHAEVIAGIDLSKLTEKNVESEQKGGRTTLLITLPAPEILISKLDNEKTRVYDRRTGLFAPNDKDLESEARSKAELSIRQAACDSNILGVAAENAEKQIVSMFTLAGFDEVRVTVAPSKCQ